MVFQSSVLVISTLFLSILEEEAFRTVEAVVVPVLLLAHHIHLSWEEDLQLQVFHIVLIQEGPVVAFAFAYEMMRVVLEDLQKVARHTLLSLEEEVHHILPTWVELDLTLTLTLAWDDQGPVQWMEQLALALTCLPY